MTVRWGEVRCEVKRSDHSTRGRSGTDWPDGDEDARLYSPMIDWRNTESNTGLFTTPSCISPTNRQKIFRNGKEFWRPYIVSGMSISMWENHSKLDGESGEIEDYQHWPGPKFWIVISTSKMIHPALCILSLQIKDQLNMDRISKNLSWLENFMIAASTLDLLLIWCTGRSWL